MSDRATTAVLTILPLYSNNSELEIDFESLDELESLIRDLQATAKKLKGEK